MTETARTYPDGVPCWVDLETADPDAAVDFYGGLLGWEFRDAMPADAPGRYLVAMLDGQDVGAIASGVAVLGQVGAWNTYVAVDDPDATAAAVERAGGTVMAPPTDNPGGRAAVCVDAEGAGFRLWQAGRRVGAQAVNRPGGWGFSDLRSADLGAARDFYASLFPWRYSDAGAGGVFVAVPGYGDHLAAGADPGIHDRQVRMKAPPGFADVVARLQAANPGEPPHWHVSFGVVDRDAAADRAERLGGHVWARTENPWQRIAIVSDPQGAPFSLSQFVPPA